MYPKETEAVDVGEATYNADTKILTFRANTPICMTTIKELEFKVNA